MLSPGVKLIPNLVTRIEELVFEKCPSQHCNVMCFRMWLRVGIIPNEQISRDLHQRFLLENAGHTEHSDWKSF